MRGRHQGGDRRAVGLADQQDLLARRGVQQRRQRLGLDADVADASRTARWPAKPGRSTTTISRFCGRAARAGAQYSAQDGAPVTTTIFQGAGLSRGVSSAEMRQPWPPPASKLDAAHDACRDSLRRSARVRCARRAAASIQASPIPRTPFGRLPLSSSCLLSSSVWLRTRLSGRLVQGRSIAPRGIEKDLSAPFSLASDCRGPRRDLLRTAPDVLVWPWRHT